MWKCDNDFFQHLCVYLLITGNRLKSVCVRLIAPVYSCQSQPETGREPADCTLRHVLPRRELLNSQGNQSLEPPPVGAKPTDLHMAISVSTVCLGARSQYREVGRN